MICRDPCVGAAGQTAPTNGLQPPLEMLFDVVSAAVPRPLGEPSRGFLRAQGASPAHRGQQTGPEPSTLGAWGAPCPDASCSLHDPAEGVTYNAL